jgi:hypothetical protein
MTPADVRSGGGGIATVAGRTLLVAPGHPTIGDALGSAPDGGVVAVAAGTYPETFELHDRRLTIRAHEGGEVILDGTGGDWPVLKVRGGSLITSAPVGHLCPCCSRPPATPSPTASTASSTATTTW